MPRWTEEQQVAIDKDNTNIIVSAGAGSGKTAVLTARTIRKIQDGVNVDDLLIITFTNAAAFEMKERIRKAIEKDEKLIDQLELIDSAYITTFDSFALSIVKKYHYLKNISKNIKITETSLLELERIKILERIFDRLYKEEEANFLQLIEDLTFKDDKVIFQDILSIYRKLEQLHNIEEYFNNYFDKHHNNKIIKENYNAYLKLLTDKQNLLKLNISDLSLDTTGDYITKLETTLDSLLTATTYNEFASSFNYERLPMLPKNSSEFAKSKKNNISSIIDDLKKLIIYEDELEIKNSIETNISYNKVIISILEEYHQTFKTYKEKNNYYEFADIMRLAIEILEENEEARLELKNKFNEIMIDEYQDTNDIGEYFISLISNNNTYMVGDIKQSIYRFRNANPYIFKEKYDRYSKNNDGFKIDLNKNFRSREEVITAINFMFDEVMNDNIGNADYKATHRMVFGNNTYNEIGKTEENYSLEVYNYQKDKEDIYSKDEYEIFLIAKDIMTKVSTKYLVFDKDENKTRPIEYKDFVILIDRTKTFDLYKKIFEYYNIPLTIYKDEKLTGGYDIDLFKHILLLLKKVNNKEFDKEFEYSYTSVSRSFLISETDSNIFKTLKNKLYKETVLFKKLVNLIIYIEEDCYTLLNKIIEEFNYYEKLITIGSIEEYEIKLTYLLNLTKQLANLGYSLEDLYDYLNEVLSSEMDLKYSLVKENNNSVKIMTIHRSKGLEYPICYFPALNNKFNLRELTNTFLYDIRYGIITPYLKEDKIKKNIMYLLLNESYIKEEISEKIRLFYVALTRAREKLILVTSLNDKEIEELDDSVKMKYRSFQSLIDSIKQILTPYVTNIEVNNLTKAYNSIKEDNYQSEIENNDYNILVEELSLNKEEVAEKQYSKVNKTVITKEQETSRVLGNKLHQTLEYIDFNNPDYSDCSDYIKNKIEAFLNQDIIKNNLDKTFLKEYEFYYTNNNEKKHGIIDLLITLEDSIVIIDYKLKNIKDEAYLVQLNGYKEFIEDKFHKSVSIYLYSILDEKLEEIS